MEIEIKREITKHGREEGINKKQREKRVRKTDTNQARSK
jgi:hypothetical protein